MIMVVQNSFVMEHIDEMLVRAWDSFHYSFYNVLLIVVFIYRAKMYPM